MLEARGRTKRTKTLNFWLRKNWQSHFEPRCEKVVLFLKVSSISISNFDFYLWFFGLWFWFFSGFQWSTTTWELFSWRQWPRRGETAVRFVEQENVRACPRARIPPEGFCCCCSIWRPLLEHIWCGRWLRVQSSVGLARDDIVFLWYVPIFLFFLLTCLIVVELRTLFYSEY